MTPISLIVLENIARVATCTEAGAITADPVVAVRDGRVVWLDSRADLPEEFASAERRDCGGKLLTPALIDCHTHPAFVRARAEEFEMRLGGATYQEIAAAGGGIAASTAGVREADDIELAAQTERNFNRLRRHGVAVLEAKSGYGLSLEHELRQLCAIGDAADRADMHVVRTCLAAHSLPPEFRGGESLRNEYLDLVCHTILPRVAAEGLAERADVFCEQGVFSVEEARRVGAAAKAAGLRMTIHADQLSDSSGAALAAEMGADSADHLEFTGAAGISAMKAAGVAAVLLPGATWMLRMDRWADARAMIDAGLTVALATDFNPGSSPVCSPAFVMNLAMLELKMSAQEALLAFTVNAARALRLPAAEYGRIAPGARAAFALWDVDHEREIPYYAGGNLCTEVITCHGWRD